MISSSESQESSDDHSDDDLDSIWDRLAACPPRPGMEVHPNVLLPPREHGPGITPSVWDEMIREMLDIPIEDLISPPESPRYY